MNATVMGILFGGIISILVSLFFYLLQKRSRYPGELRLAVTDFKRIVSKGREKLDKLSLKYEGYEVNKNLVYFEIIITNRRSYDIRNDDSASPLTLSLPKGSKWIDVQVKSCNMGVSPGISFKDNDSFNINWNLLRKGEFILLAGLIETSSIFSDEKLLDVVSVSHRIPNLSPIKKVSVGDNDYYKKMTRACWVYFAVMSLLLLASIFITPKLSNIRYVDMDTKEVVSLYVDKSDSLVLYHGFFKQERVPSLEMGTRFVPVYKHSNNPSYVIWMALIVMFFNATILVEVYIKRYKTFNILRLLRSY